MEEQAFQMYLVGVLYYRFYTKKDLDYDPLYATASVSSFLRFWDEIKLRNLHQIGKIGSKAQDFLNV